MLCSLQTYLTDRLKLMFVLSILPLDCGLVAPIEKQAERMRELATGGNGALSAANKCFSHSVKSSYFLVTSPAPISTCVKLPLCTGVSFSLKCFVIGYISTNVNRNSLTYYCRAILWASPCFDSALKLFEFTYKLSLRWDTDHCAQSHKPGWSRVGMLFWCWQ